MMMKMKKRGLICLLLILAMTMGACGKKEAPASTPSPDTGTETEADAKEDDVPEDDSWLAQANLDATETPDELYEAAKEEGKVVIYSMSSRIAAIKDDFEAEYPGVEVEYYDLRMAEIFEKFEREYEAGIRNVDVIFAKDSDGMVYNEFFKEGLLHAYMPEDLVANVDDQFKKFAYVPYFERKQIFYNTEVYDESPITSWWDLTKPEYKGRVMFGNPVGAAEIMGVFLAIVQNADEMEKDYKEVFGEDIVLDGTENAGYEWIKRIAANDPILTTSDGDMVKAIGAEGQENPPFGIATSSKLRDRDKGLKIGVSDTLTPRDGVMAPAILAITDQSEHVNAAKLLIRFMGGESDGQGPGFDPFRVVGSWPTRSDMAPLEDTPTLDKLNLWDLDLDYNYEMNDKIREFWLTQQ